MAHLGRLDAFCTCWDGVTDTRLASSVLRAAYIRDSVMSFIGRYVCSIQMLLSIHS
jgi:hypothetical protein